MCLLVGQMMSYYSATQLYNKQIWQTNVDFDMCSDNPQSIWNHFEETLVPVIDELAPLVDFTNNTKVENNPPVKINSKLNLRKKLFKKLKQSPTPELKHRVKNLNFEIRSFYMNQKKSCNSALNNSGKFKIPLERSTNRKKYECIKTPPDHVTKWTDCP